MDTKYEAPHQKLGSLLRWLDRRAPQLQPLCRWLALGPQLAESLLLDDLARSPSLADLLELSRLLAREAPELWLVGMELIDRSDHCAAARVEIQLDVLCAADADSWEHPTQILSPPRVSLARLADACTLRRRQARGQQRQHLEQVEAKLRRAAEIAASAAKRRARRAKKQQAAARRRG